MFVILTCDRCGCSFQGTLEKKGDQVITTGFIWREYGERMVCQSCIEQDPALRRKYSLPVGEHEKVSASKVSG